jgi:hypothetical protein
MTRRSPTRELAVERRTLERALPRLRVASCGRFVLIHGRKVIGTYESEDAALEAGYGTFGPRGVFLIDEIAITARVYCVSRFEPS